jgi:hypothetical protein
MADVVDFGERDRPARRWPAVVVVALLAAAIGTAAFASRRTPHAPAHPSAAPAPLPSPSVPPLETIPVEDVGDPFGGMWSAPPHITSTHLRVAGAGLGLLAMDVDSGRSFGDAALRTDPDNAVRPLAALRDGWLVVYDDYVYAVRHGRATRVGHGTVAFLDPVDGTVWLTYGGEAESDSLDRTLEHRTLDGAGIGRRSALSRSEVLRGVTTYGPVLAADVDSNEVTLLDRRTRARRAVDGRLLAVGRDVVVTKSEGCDFDPVDGCRIAVTTIESHAFVSADLAGLRAVPVLAAVDPGDRRLAVSYGAGGGPGAAIVDLGSGAVTELHGLAYPPQVTAMAWAPDGKWLVLGHDFEEGGGGVELALWRTGAATVVSAPSFPGLPGGGLAVTYAR